MDLDLYISDGVDQLRIPLNYRQRNFLHRLFRDHYERGDKLGKEVQDKALFESQAVDYLKEGLQEHAKSREILEKLSGGDWDGIVDRKQLLLELKDRFFSRNQNHISKEELFRNDLLDYETYILDKAFKFYEEGLEGVLYEWAKRRVMDLAIKELARQPDQSSERIKVKPETPLVTSSELPDPEKEAKQIWRDYYRLVPAQRNFIVDLFNTAYKQGTNTVEKDFFTRAGSIGTKDLREWMTQYDNEKETIAKMAEGDEKTLDIVLGATNQNGQSVSFPYKMFEKHFIDGGGDFDVARAQALDLDINEVGYFVKEAFGKGVEARVDELARDAITDLAAAEVAEERDEP